MVKKAIDDTISKSNAVKNERDVMIKSVVEFSKLHDIWFAIDERKKQPTNHTNNDIIIFLSSIAKKFGAQNFVVELKSEQDNKYYGINNAVIKFNTFNEPSIFLIMNSFRTIPDYEIFINKLFISRNDANVKVTVSQNGLVEYNRKINNALTLLANGQKYTSLPELLSVTLELKILLIR